MHHIFVENENTIYSFAENSVVQSSGINLKKEDLINNPIIRYVKSNPIFYAGIALTNHCNLTCKHCSVITTKKPNESNFYEKDDIHELLNILYKQGLTRLSITGGEPFLYPHLQYFYDILGKLGIESKINTNGTAIKNNILSHMISNGLTEIDISINSFKDDSDTYIDSKNFTNVRIETIKRIVENFKGKVNITASSVLTKEISNNLIEIADLLSKIGVDSWRLRELMQSTNEIKNIPLDIFNDDSLLVTNIGQLIKQEFPVRIWGYLYDTIKEQKVTMRCDNLENNYLFVGADKTVVWYSGLRNSELGYWSNYDIGEIASKLAYYRQETLSFPKRCEYCSAKQICLLSQFANEVYINLKNQILSNNK